jgi:methylmalonyl-CoA mutase C-terminal domain/subunit
LTFLAGVRLLGLDDAHSKAAGTAGQESRQFFGKECTMTERRIRVLIAKPGLDGHDRGAKVVARALRDAGMEVIYTGLRQTPEMIAEAALQEDVDVVGLSILSGAHMALVPRVLELLRQNGQEHVRVFVGGIIPDEDVPRLKALGVNAVYGPGTLTDDIIADIRRAVLGAEVAGA